MRQSLCVCAGMLIGLVGGCACGGRTAEQGMEYGPVAAASAPRSSVLLFDAQPGPWSATDFAYRSDWPSTDAYYTPGQLILYRQRFTDYQGPQFGNQNGWTYRRSDSYRYSVGYR